MMNNARFEDALTDVAKVFADPKDIIGAEDLSQQQKVKLLRQWEFDLRENLVASEENMTAETTPEGHSAELLRGVRKALISMGAVDHKDESAAPTKTGGA
jgi:phage portal protein BeeE